MFVGMDSLLPRVSVPHGTCKVQRPGELDSNIPQWEWHRSSVREVGVPWPVSDRVPRTSARLCSQQDRQGGVVCVQLWCSQRSTRIRTGTLQTYSGNCIIMRNFISREGKLIQSYKNERESFNQWCRVCFNLILKTKVWFNRLHQTTFVFK